MPTYRLHDSTGDDLGPLEHPAPNVWPGVVMLPDAREALVTARVDAEPSPPYALYSAPVEIDQSHLVREPFQVAYALERGDESYVDVPVLTEIEPGLWFGGAPEPRAPEGFDFIVNLASPWARYDPNGIECVNVTVEDGEVTAEVARQFGDLAQEVNRRRDLGQTILVHCQAGLNRSATVVALALMLRGMAASDAIWLLREKRHRLAVCNPHFERWLLDSSAVAR